jgi:hypothetical protein
VPEPQHIPAISGDCRTIISSSPIFVAILSYFFLREGCNPFIVTTMAITAAGVLIVLQVLIYLIYLFLPSRQGCHMIFAKRPNF